MARTTKILLAAALTLGLLASGPALAASGDAGVAVDILVALDVTATQPMDFGEILPPSVGNQDFVLAPAGGITPGAGDGTQAGASDPAIFDVTGEANKAITVTPSISANFADAALTLGTLTTAGDTATIPAGGVGQCNMGGTLTVGSAADPATVHTATVTLTVVYQ